MATVRSGGRGGLSFVELVVTLTILSVLLSWSVPRYDRAIEQSQVDVAAANLWALWTAQRMYRVDNGAFAPDLQTLLSAKLIDPASTVSKRFSYSVASSGPDVFEARAMSLGGGGWSGTLSIAEQGVVTGTVTSGEGVVLGPP